MLSLDSSDPHCNKLIMGSRLVYGLMQNIDVLVLKHASL